MLKKLRPLLLLATLAGSKLFGQTGDIKVTLVDEKTTETVPFAGVVILQKNYRIVNASIVNGNLRLLKPIHVLEFSFW